MSIQSLPKSIFIPISIIFIIVAVIFLAVQIIAGLESTVENGSLTNYAAALIMLVALLTLHTFADPGKPRIRAATQILSFVVFMLIVLGNFQDDSDDTTMAIIVLIISLFLMRGLQYFSRRLRYEFPYPPKRSKYS